MSSGLKFFLTYIGITFAVGMLYNCCPRPDRSYHPKNEAKADQPKTRYEAWFTFDGKLTHVTCEGVIRDCGVSFSHCDDGFDYDCIHAVKNAEVK